MNNKELILEIEKLCKIALDNRHYGAVQCLLNAINTIKVNPILYRIYRHTPGYSSEHVKFVKGCENDAMEEVAKLDIEMTSYKHYYEEVVKK